MISLCINRHWTHSCSLECGSSDSSSEKRVGMAPSAYLLPSTYYTKLELQVYFLIPQLDSSILSSKMVLFITVSILSSYVQHLLHSEGIGQRDVSVNNVIGLAAHKDLCSGSFVLWGQLVSFLDHSPSPLCWLLCYITYVYYVGALLECKAQKKHNHARRKLWRFLYLTIAVIRLDFQGQQERVC